VEAATEAVDPAEDDPTRNFSMLSISDDMLDFLASGGSVAVTEGVTVVTVAGFGSISWISITPSRISLRTSSFPTSSMGLGAAAREDGVEAGVTELVVDVVEEVDDDEVEEEEEAFEADEEVEPSSELLATPRPDVGILCCKTVAVVEVADVVAFTVPAALSAG